MGIEKVWDTFISRLTDHIQIQTVTAQIQGRKTPFKMSPDGERKLTFMRLAELKELWEIDGMIDLSGDFPIIAPELTAWACNCPCNQPTDWRKRTRFGINETLSPTKKKTTANTSNKEQAKNLFRQNMRKRKEKGMQCKECEIHDIPKELPECPGCHGPLTKDTPQKPHNPLTHNSQPLTTPIITNYTPSRAHRGSTPLNRAQRRKVPYALRKVVYSPRWGS